MRPALYHLTECLTTYRLWACRWSLRYILRTTLWYLINTWLTAPPLGKPPKEFGTATTHVHGRLRTMRGGSSLLVGWHSGGTIIAGWTIDRLLCDRPSERSAARARVKAQALRRVTTADCDQCDRRLRSTRNDSRLRSMIRATRDRVMVDARAQLESHAAGRVCCAMARSVHTALTAATSTTARWRTPGNYMFW